MRFLVVVTVIATLVKAFKLNCITGKSKSNETSSETDNDLHFNETWTWLPYTVNISESKNVANPWDKILPVRGDTLPIYNEETNWCVHIGDPFEKVNFSKFQVCSSMMNCDKCSMLDVICYIVIIPVHSIVLNC